MPTGALDRETGEEVLGLFQKLNKNGHTIVMITHDLHVARSAKRYEKISVQKGEAVLCGCFGREHDGQDHGGRGGYGGGLRFGPRNEKRGNPYGSGLIKFS